MKKSTIIYFYAAPSSFVVEDIKVLSRYFHIKRFRFSQKSKILSPVFYGFQLIYLILNSFSANAYVIMFGGHHSLLPALFGKIFWKPCFIINGGTDCVSFPSIGYGNFRGGMLNKVTRWSYNLAACLLPVHRSLEGYDYTYDNRDYNRQGIKAFMPALDTPVKEVNFGFDPERWKMGTNRQRNSFITVAAGLENHYRAELKGVDLIVRAASELPDATFTIVGCPDNHSLGQLPKNVVTMSFVSNEKLVELYGRHEFYIQVSMSEGFPNAISEAMLCGCIPIGSMVGGIPDIVGDTGFLLAYRDFNAFKDLVAQALSANKNELSLKARSRIMEKYPKDKREKELVAVINSYLIK